jgi:hypothetical protein
MTQDESVELIEWIEEGQRRAANRVLRKAAVGFAILLFGLLFAGNAWKNQLHDGLKGSCSRVNVLRAQSNGSDLVSFRILSISAQREAILAKKDKANAATHSKSAKGLASEAQRLTVTRLTDCEEAVNDPDHYSTPVAGPIGDPKTGELSEGVKQTLIDSEKLLRKESTR